MMRYQITIDGEPEEGVWTEASRAEDTANAIRRQLCRYAVVAVIQVDEDDEPC